MMGRAFNGGGKVGKKLSKAEADARDLDIIARVARGENRDRIAARHGVTLRWIVKLLADARADARAPLGRNGDIRGLP